MTSEDSQFGRAARGTLLIFVGNGLGMALGFLARIGIANLTSPDFYGTIVLGVTLLNVLVVFSLLGLEKGVARNIPVADVPTKILASAIQSTVFMSFIVTVLALSVLQVVPGISQKLSTTLSVFIIGVPFLALLRLAKGVFQGTEDPLPKVISQDIVRRVSVIALSVTAIWAGFGVVGAAVGWILGVIFASLVAVALVRNRSPELLGYNGLFSFSKSTTSSLLVFSLPIMLSDSTWRLMQEIDNLLIVFYFDKTAQVGIYDASYTLTRSMLIFLWTFQFLFLPIFTKLYNANDYDELVRFYSSVTKWLLSLSLPAVFIMVFYPGLIIRTIYGEAYIDGRIPLVILSIGFLTFVTTGLSRHAITGIGSTKLVFAASLLSLFVDIALNVLLIPKFGIAGAALATSTAFATGNLVLTGLLFYNTGIHPVSHSLWLPVGITTVLLIAVNIVAYPYINATQHLFAIVAVVFIISTVVFGTIGTTESDQEMLDSIKSKI